MDTQKLTLSGLLAASLLGNVGLLVAGKYEPVQVVAEATADTEMAAVVAAAPKECADELRQIPDADTGINCALGKTQMGDDKESTEVLICNGAVMPSRLRSCIEDTKANLPPPVEEPVGEAEVGNP